MDLYNINLRDKNNVSKQTIFLVPKQEVEESIVIKTGKSSKQTIEEMINEAINFQMKGNISEAVKHYKNLINQDIDDYRIFVNYGVILKGIGKLEEAAKLQRKAIELKPDFGNAYYNLGTILKGLGKLEEAEIYLRKAIKLNPNFAEAFSNLGNLLSDLGKSEEAEILLRQAIELKPDFAEAYSNLGTILRDLGKLKEAESYTRKAIELNPICVNSYFNLATILLYFSKKNDAEKLARRAIQMQPNSAKAYYNFGVIMKNLGKFKDAEISLCKAIQLKPDYAKVYYLLSKLKDSINNKLINENLFSMHILNNQSKLDLIDIYFARANFLHKKRKFKESSKYLRLANNNKLSLKKSKSDSLINKSKLLSMESNHNENHNKDELKSYQSIFIVGMFRSGSTLVESILSMNSLVKDLGEINILEKSFLHSKMNNQELTLPELYWKYTDIYNSGFMISTNKWLYNYQYAGIISCQIPNAKIIHCLRHPLDNILSIYRANFANGSEYASSLVDCAKVYLNHEEIMDEYKNRFRSKIYDLNYDLLVSDTNQHIKSLIHWLGWEWNDAYLSPHLSSRIVSTASSVQVRSPINSNSIGGWKNYKEMLKPAIEILVKSNRYRDLIS